MQIANNVPWFGMMKCQRAGDGGARCSVYGLGELASNIYVQEKMATDGLPHLVPDRNGERALAQQESINLAVTLFNLAAGWEDACCSPSLGQPESWAAPGTSAQHVDFGQAPGPMRSQGKLALEAEPLSSAWRLFCSACSSGRSRLGAEILLRLAEPILGTVAV